MIPNPDLLSKSYVMSYQIDPNLPHKMVFQRFWVLLTVRWGAPKTYVPCFMLYFMHFSRWWSYQIVFTLTFPIRVLSSPKNFTAHHQNDWLLIRPEPIVLLHNVISKWMKCHIRKLLFLRWVQVTSKSVRDR